MNAGFEKPANLWRFAYLFICPYFLPLCSWIFFLCCLWDDLWNTKKRERQGRCVLDHPVMFLLGQHQHPRWEMKARYYLKIKGQSLCMSQLENLWNEIIGCTQTSKAYLRLLFFWKSIWVLVSKNRELVCGWLQCQWGDDPLFCTSSFAD